MSSLRDQDARLLGALFSFRGQPVARGELSLISNVPVAALEGRLAPYMVAGYPLAFHPHGTLSLGEPPDIWCAEEILGRCPPPPSAGLPAWNPLLLAETGSTNDVAREQAQRGASAGLVVAATRQTAGRGRLGRTWESPAGRGLYVSLLLRPDLGLAGASQLTILASVAAVDAVEAVTGLRPRIKWPNDLMMQGRKLAGLLLETEIRGRELAFAVVGLGLNVRHAENDFPTELRARATSLLLATGQLYRRADLLVAFLEAFHRRLAQPFAETRDAWAASSLTLGQQVELTTTRGVRHGQALGLDESGALLLRLNSGEVENVTAGDLQPT